MSSGEDDAPLPDDSLSYDGYKMSSSEEGHSPVYPIDDRTLYEEALIDLRSKYSFKTDKFPNELTMPSMIRSMGGKLGVLNRDAFAICEEARGFVNQIYRTDEVLKHDSYVDEAWEIKHEAYTSLMDLNRGDSGLAALLRQINLLGGPYYNPPANLWKYLYFFWYDSASTATDGSSVTPIPDCHAPDFHTKLCSQNGDIGMIMDALMEDEFAIAPELDTEDNKALVQDLKCLQVMAEKYWKSHKADLLPGSTSSNITAGLYAEMLRMEEMAKQKISAIENSGQSCFGFPFILKNALDCFKDGKEK